MENDKVDNNEDLMLEAIVRQGQDQTAKLDELNKSSEMQVEAINETNKELGELNRGVDLILEKMSQDTNKPMPTSDPADGTNTLWYDPETRQVFMGT